MTGAVLLINGPSSSGKTTLCRSLQAAWAGPLALVGLDMLIGALHPAYTGFGERAGEGFPLLMDSDPEGRPLIRAATGPAGRILNRRLAEFAAGCAADGLDVVIDHVLLSPQDLDDFAAALDPSSSWLFGVRCDLAVLELRERAREDRALSLAREQARRVHPGAWSYDLTLDSTADPPHVLATQVLEAVAASTPAALAAYLAGSAARQEVAGREL